MTNSLTQRLWKILIKRLLSWFILTLIILMVANHYNSLNDQNLPVLDSNFVTTLTPAASNSNCGSLLPEESVYVMDPSFMKRTDIFYSGLEIQSNYDHPMVIVLSDPTATRKFLAASIFPGKGIQVSIPIGQYGMQVLVGSDWCNLEAGFSDGKIISVSGGISIHAGATTSMQFDGSGLNPVQLALAYNILQLPRLEEIEPPPAEVIGIGRLELHQTKEGHYFSSGTINGFPVVFMIDTGATIVSISAEIAARAGIKKCTPHSVETANGMVKACMATVPEITFGSFKLTHIDVNVMPNTSGNALLGMNVLRQFHIEQVNKTMRIAAP